MTIAEEHISLAVVAGAGPQRAVGRAHVKMARGPEHISQGKSRPDVAHRDQIRRRTDARLGGGRDDPTGILAVPAETEIRRALERRGPGCVDSVLALTAFAVLVRHELGTTQGAHRGGFVGKLVARNAHVRDQFVLPIVHHEPTITATETHNPDASSRREMLVVVHVHSQGQTQSAEIVAALGCVRPRLAPRQRRQEQARQNRDDRHHDQQFD